MKTRTITIIQLKIGFFIAIIAVVCGLVSECSAQKKVKTEGYKYIYPEFINSGRTVESLKSFLATRGKSNPYFTSYSNNEKRYDFKHDVRVNGEMFLSSYNYIFKNDSCKLIVVRPPVKQDWESDLLKNHSFVGTIDENGKKLRVYEPADKGYRLYMPDGEVVFFNVIFL